MEVFRGKRVWVHCAVNYRVSAFLYHYLRTVRKLDDSASRSSVFDWWDPDDTWREFLALELSEMEICGNGLAKSVQRRQSDKVTK
jgi:hypothetical protein